MTLAEIREMPTRVSAPGFVREIDESCFRSFQCLMYVKALCMKNVAPEVILEIIDDVLDAPFRSREL